MRIGESTIKIIGIILAIVGLLVILSALGLHLFGIILNPVWLAVLIGIGLIVFGAYLIRGGQPVL